MGLFGKKSPCPICGGKIGWLLPAKVEGEYVCSDCHGKIDMQQEIQDSLTMQQFREYLAFYEQNKLLKDRFIISQKVDFGLLDTKIIFDFENKLFCMSKRPDKTVFEGKQLVSFTIREDNALLVEGSADGIRRYQSSIPEKTAALAPQLLQYITTRRMAENLERMANEEKEEHRYIPPLDIPEPFKQFNVELHFEHPYWNILRCNMSGPTFSDERPDVDDYLREYNRDIETIEQLVNALKAVAFPDAPEQSVEQGAGTAAFSAQPVQPPADAIEEIKKYKALMEEGIISEEEFQAKKKKLLGI